MFALFIAFIVFLVLSALGLAVLVRFELDDVVSRVVLALVAGGVAVGIYLELSQAAPIPIPVEQPSQSVEELIENSHKKWERWNR